jgi:hypothetical protein
VRGSAKGSIGMAEALGTGRGAWLRSKGEGLLGCAWVRVTRRGLPTWTGAALISEAGATAFGTITPRDR